MQFITALASGAALLSGLAAAQNVQSKPFTLSVVSTNKTLNGQFFQSCHEGAAIESLCLLGKEDENAQFYLNTTMGATSSIKGDSPSGVLNWYLKGGNFVEDEPMYLYADPSTNVGLPLFEPSYNEQYVAFDNKGHMNIPVYSDDTKAPTPTYKSRALDRWYVCTYNYSGYNYQTLNWVYGEGKPQNPTCQKVSVKRTFV